MLFSGKKNVFKLFGCLKIHFTENQFWCLVRSNIFTENALHSQSTQFSIHFLNCKHVDNESISYSFTKETKPSKKIHQIRSNWDRTAEEKVRSCGGGEIEQRRDRAARCCDRRAARCYDRRSARFDNRTGAQSVVVGLELRVRRQSLFFLSLCDLGSLFSLSLSLSLSLRKCFEVKLGTENNFRGQSLIFTVNWK